MLINLVEVLSPDFIIYENGAVGENVIKCTSIMLRISPIITDEWAISYQT